MTLCVQSLDFAYGRNRIYDHFNISFQNGIHILIGSNGSGKTTLMKLLAGIYTPKSGQILLNDKKYSDYPDIRRLIAYIPQEFDAYKDMTVRDFLTFIAEIKQRKKSKFLQSSIDEAMKTADVAEFAQKKIKALSGGMKKRVGIAQALVSNAQILIADEPTAALDPEQCESFSRILKRISSDKIIILSTHILQDIYAGCDQIYVLSDGVLKFQGTKPDLDNTLKNKIFKVRKESGDTWHDQNLKILDEIEENGQLYWKIAVDDPNTLGVDYEPCAYTSADIWRYYK